MKNNNTQNFGTSSEPNQDLFSKDGVYNVNTISHLPAGDFLSYSDKLLNIRLSIVKHYAINSKLLDVCCATGQHLLGFSDQLIQGVGLDFSFPYLQKAEQNNIENPTAKKTTFFACADAKNMPFRSEYFDISYSFSSLYVIPNVEEVIKEMSRTLKKGGKCILDMGNTNSINGMVIARYHQDLGWAELVPLSVSDMKKCIQNANLQIIQHRSFQILPLYEADRPKWLRVFLLPFWTTLLSKQIFGKLLDEWISSLPIINYFAFRHIFICEKS